MRLLIALAPLFCMAQPAEVLMRMDREFAAETAKRGVDGFADWLAEKDILKFQPKGHPLTTREEVRADMKKRLAGKPFLLQWEPLKAEIAASGELGWTFGRWTSGAARGYYFTVWKKQPNGRWKAIVDFGNPE